MPADDSVGRYGSRHLWCVAVLICAAMSALVWGYTVDDAYIVFRYARNLIEGHGPVYNVGERVEGYTSPLWLMLATAAEALRLPTEQVCKIASLLTVMVFIRSVSRRLVGLHPTAQAPLVLLAAYSPLHVAIVSGLETAVNAAIIGWLVLSSSAALAPGLCPKEAPSGGERESLSRARSSVRAVPHNEDRRRGEFSWPQLAAYGGLALVCRPENGLLVVIHGMYLWWAAPRMRRGIWAAAGVWLAVLVVEMAARLAYYGAWLPNTAVAKMSTEAALGVGGWFYCRTWLGCSWWLVLLGIPSLLHRDTRRLAVNAWLLVAGQTAFVFISGGDWMPQWRFLLPAAVLLTIVGCISVDATVSAGRILSAAGRPGRAARWVGTTAGIACAAVIVSQIWHFRSVRWTQEHYRRQLEALAAGPVRYLGERAGEGELVVARDIGVLGYRTRCRVLDMVGLTDLHVARSSGYRHRDRIDVDYVYGRQPAYLMLQSGKERSEPMPLDDLALALTRDGRFGLYDLCDRWELPGRHYCEVYRRRGNVDQDETPKSMSAAEQ